MSVVVVLPDGNERQVCADGVIERGILIGAAVMSDLDDVVLAKARRCAQAHLRLRGKVAQQQDRRDFPAGHIDRHAGGIRSEEHTSELQSLMRISYAVFCLKKKIVLVDEIIILII